jgi:hypothetical protein
MPLSRIFAASLIPTFALVLGCGGDASKVWQCQSPAGTTPDYLAEIGCLGDFEVLASEPLDASIPGARSGKIVLDQFDDDALYFQNSNEFQIHHDFAAQYLSGPDHPLVPSLSEFNANQYTSADRRFLLGAVTHYEGPDIWALEIAPYDTASPDMITKLYEAVRQHVYFGSKLAFHPTSEAVEAVAKKLPASVAIATTASIFAGTDYQPLNTGESLGQLRFVKSAEIETAYAGFRDIVVLDSTPTDISVVAGIISAEFQTPLSHNQRARPQPRHANMGLRGAFDDPSLRALEGKWVRLVVGAFEYTIAEVTQSDADTWWEAHKPQPRDVPPTDLSVTDLRDIEYVVLENAAVPMRQSIETAIRAFGAQVRRLLRPAQHPRRPDPPGLRDPGLLLRPVHEAERLLRSGEHAARRSRVPRQAGGARRGARPASRRHARRPGRRGFPDAAQGEAGGRFPGPDDAVPQQHQFGGSRRVPLRRLLRLPHRRSANWGVDVPTCNTDGNKNCSVLQAIRKTWATIWKLRTFEEREYHSIDHTAVGMALLVHHNFAQEEANGVAVTANPFDPSGLVPGFYVNVQWGGGAEVVNPPPGSRATPSSISSPIRDSRSSSSRARTWCWRERPS